VKLGAREHVVFGGSMLADPQSAIERAMVNSAPYVWRDRRNWDEIRAWATRVAAELRADRAAA
jgi:menaquinone-dependent protoporphyrinogen oxidase